MGWLGDFFRGLGGEAPTDLVFAPNVPVSGVTPEPLTPDECYVELYVESARLTHARRFATKFHGLVYSFVSLPREGDGNAKYAAVSKPEKLAELDKNSLDKVITVSRQMMGTAPWRGGRLNLELGLFSVKSGNILTPVLDYVTKVSSTAGMSFVGTIKPFVPLITEGMDLIAGQRDDTAIEVAVDTSLELTTSGYYAIINIAKDTIDLGKLSIDPTDKKLRYNGKPLDAGYCVFSIRRNLKKSDYGEIPDLKERYAAVMAAIQAGKQNDARDALTVFRLATIASADLIPLDARNLVAKAKKKVDEAFPAEGTAMRLTATVRDLQSLSAIGLYD